MRHCTFDVEPDIVRAVELVVLGTDLAVVESVVGRSHVVNDQAPHARPLIVVYADARVPDEREQPDRQRVDVIVPTPRDLQPVVYWGGDTRVYGVYQPPVFFDSVYSSQ